MIKRCLQICNLKFPLLFLFVVQQANASEPTPYVVQRFFSNLSAKGPDSVVPLVTIPVEAHERGYDMQNGNCIKLVKRSIIRDRDELLLVLAQFRKGLKLSKQKPMQVMKRVYGVLAWQDCEHVWRVHLDQKGSKIIRLDLDTNLDVDEHRSEFRYHD